MFRSVSQPSLGTVSKATRGSRTLLQVKTAQKFRGQRLWEGRLGTVTRAVLTLPWNHWWQMLILVTVIYKYCLHLVVGYLLDSSSVVFDTTFVFAELLFCVDVGVHCLHLFWPIVRLHTRIYRRSFILLAYDVFSLLPFYSIAHALHLPSVSLVGRWLIIARIYRVLEYFRSVNDTMHASRLGLYFVQHVTVLVLFLHGATCIWHSLHRVVRNSKDWYKTGYPPHVTARKLVFKGYDTCLYYCTCRLLNCIFGDSFPISVQDKWFTILVMMFGYIYVRYRFIGYLTWELILRHSRWAKFLEQYHHVIRYLNFRGAPTSLIEQTMKYKQKIWSMKDGVLTTEYLYRLPLPLQMELIFDINVGHFHDSLLLEGTGEAFLRHISLLMKHEIYLAGQHVWSQGVVKGGMICIKRGVVEMLSDEDDESPVIAFEKGTVLGELSLFYSIPSKVTVKAATYVEVQILHRTDFMREMTENPQLLNQIRNKIETRLASAKSKQQAIQRNDTNDSRLLRTRYRPMKTLKDHLFDVQEEDSTFVDDSHMYYRDENNVSQPKFTVDYLHLYKMSKNVSSIETPKICLRGTFPWILEPNTNFLHLLDVAHFAVIVYICVMSPYYTIEASQTNMQMALDALVYAALLFNIYIQLTTAIVVKNVKKETVREIAEVKMSTVGFYLDALSIFPLYIFTDTLDPYRELFVSQLTSLLPVVQVWHVWDYFGRWEKSFNANAKILCLLKNTLLFLIFSYWSGCFLYIVACPKKLCNEKSWMTQIIYWETKMLLTHNPKHEQPFRSSLLFGTSVFTSSGTAEIAPGPADSYMVIILCTIGTYVACVYSAKICSLYLFATRRRLEFKESMRELFYFLSVNHVSDKIKARVEKFFLVQWYYNKAVSNDEIFRDLSTNIQQEILSGDMIQTLTACPMFQGCSRDFLQTVATNTRTVVLPDNEIVQHACDIGRDMYIVKMGHCNSLDERGQVISILGPGSSIGVVEMLYGLPKVYTVVTTTNCILLHVEYSSLMQCWDTFPEVSYPLNEALEDPELQRQALCFEEGKPLVGRIYTKTNRIAKEIKESFVFVNRMEYIDAFNRLGILRYLRYFFLPGCITPHGLFLKCWCWVRFLTAVYYVVVIPYNIATKQVLNGGGAYWIDIVLYLDLLVMANVAYYNNNSLLVTHPLLTVTRYLRHAFLLDIISIFPFEELCKIISETIDMDLYRLNRILLVTRIIGTFSYWEGDIMHLHQVVVMIKFLPFALVTVNVVTSILFSNSCTCYSVPPLSNYLLVNCTRGVIIVTKMKKVRFAITEYINIYHWAFEIFLGSGCTSINITSKIDAWLLMGLQIGGLLYFSCMFGYIASTRSSTSHDLLAHNEETEDLGNFLYQENVDPVLTTKTLNYFKYVWKRTHGSDPQKICRGLNSALMEDTLVFMYERALREVPLFGKVERSFIRVITQHLQEMYFLKGDTVVQCKDVQTYIYIIYRGKVDVLSSYNEMITCMGPGGMFGNFTSKPLSCSQVAIYASRSLDLLVIPSQTFFNLIKYYPKVQDLLSKALEMSKDYILPITMDNIDDASSEDSDLDIDSQDSAFESRSGSSRYDAEVGKSVLSGTHSRSNASQAKSATSVATLFTYMKMQNLLRPGSRLYQTQGYICCVMATCNYLLVSYEILTLNDCPIILWVQAFLDIFFYLKMYLLINEAYLNKHGNLIIDLARCRKRYFKHKMWMWLDIIANFPLEIFAFCFPHPLKLLHYLRVNKLLRLKYVVHFYRYTSVELTNNLTTLQTVMTCIVVTISLHTLTCFWLLVMVFSKVEAKVRTLKMYIVEENIPPSSWDYTTSLYLVMSELTTTGGDEFKVNTLAPMLILVVCLIAGKILAATVVATSMQIAHSTKYALNKYETVTHELIDYLKNQGLSRYQSCKFWKYIQQLWVTERGRQLPILLSRTPYVMRCDLMSAMFGQHLRNCYLYADTGESFLRQLCVRLDYTIYFPGNYIVMAGDSESRMYWVESGEVAVVSVRADLTETTHELLHTGDVFGILQGLSRGIPHCFTYRAESKVAILSLGLDSCKTILPFFPEARKIILERSEILFTKISR